MRVSLSSARAGGFCVRWYEHGRWRGLYLAGEPPRLAARPWSETLADRGAGAPWLLLLTMIATSLGLVLVWRPLREWLALRDRGRVRTGRVVSRDGSLLWIGEDGAEHRLDESVRPATLSDDDDARPAVAIDASVEAAATEYRAPARPALRAHKVVVGTLDEVRRGARAAFLDRLGWSSIVFALAIVPLALLLLSLSGLRLG